MDQNEHSFASGIRPPSSIPTPGKLFDMSASSVNARSTAMAPPMNGNTLKRKTLAERAGEPARPTPAPPSSRPVNHYVRATSIAGVPRESSCSSSISSSRPSSSTSLRNVSNSSYSSSVGSSNRPPSAQSCRPQSAMSHSRLQKLTSMYDRPTTLLEVYEEESGTTKKRKGTTPFSLNPQDFPQSIHAPKVRKRYDSQMNCTLSSEGRPYSAVSMREASLKREASLSNALNSLSLNGEAGQRALSAVVVHSRSLSPTRSVPKAEVEVPPTPSHIPKLAPRVTLPAETPSPSKSPRKTPKVLPKFLNKDSNTHIAWDTDSRLEEVENMCSQFKEKWDGATTESKSLKEMMAVYKIRITELEAIRTQLTSNNSALQIELDAVKARLDTATQAIDDSKRFQNIRLDDMHRQHRRELEDAQHVAERESRRLKREHDEKLDDLKRTLENALEDERLSHQKEVQALTREGATSQQERQKELEIQARGFERLEDQMRACQNDLDRERDSCASLRTKASELTSNIVNLESSVQRLEGHIHFLESDNKSQSQAFADLEARMQAALRSAAEANDKLRTEETLRRKLHNQVQELKGNIRVFCRVRPSLEGDCTESAKISYPDDEADSKEVEVMGAEEKSSLGTITTKRHPFAFDRVFGPRSKNQDVFGEISQLVQSALDGYNVCIFCYGQTGSGKTYTMSANDGMIPLATDQIYQTAKSLEEKGWKYKMEGSYLEVYNEVLNDLLGKADEFDKKKHEIRHDMAKGKTTITDITTVDLDSPGTVESILHRASKNRSVASTKSNERSSRSHSVFILKLIGENSITGEKSEGTLNLVDLAGSERVAQSGVTGERLKETQSINKSLSCLSDVIGALGQGKEGGHVPYRNSKLTFLLQNSLGGNSKTLMFVMISPLQAHLSETLTSLKFATKVHNTHIGTAKKQTKS